MPGYKVSDIVPDIVPDDLIGDDFVGEHSDRIQVTLLPYPKDMSCDLKVDYEPYNVHDCGYEGT